MKLVRGPVWVTGSISRQVSFVISNTVTLNTKQTVVHENTATLPFRYHDISNL